MRFWPAYHAVEQISAEKAPPEQPVKPQSDKTVKAAEPTAAAQQAVAIAASAPTGVKAQEKVEAITAPMHGQIRRWLNGPSLCPGRRPVWRVSA
ncbi:hypothetical protein [Photobacterium arenosum]|uniref:hypothetical protein n=1 Tax=Photobacterium arenosum TaxID=2774143 RepID=UPI002889A127|nr:hypothetical protein [Photobacterium arenosum]